ncbi:hypothetical protein NAEX_05047 [Nannocystis exedens]|nr:hypothetical protein [Nannocystis exedens]PCC71968.1 hypothetical protein NAEX_05047 [Nannocystis exedens]
MSPSIPAAVLAVTNRPDSTACSTRTRSSAPAAIEPAPCGAS